MRKILLLLLFIINLFPCIDDKGELTITFNKVAAQDESGEFYCYDEDDWPNTSGNGSSHTNTYHDEPDAYDPTNDPDWGYPDWSEWEDWMNFLDETEMNPYRYENLWPGVVDSSLKRYYVTIDMNPERFYNNSKHSFIKRPAKIRLLLGLEGEALTRPGLSWTVNGLRMNEATNMDSLYLRGDTTTTYKVSVYKNSSWVMSFEVSIFGKPVVYFRKKDGYKGEYGFDDVGYQYDSLKNDYKKIKIDSSNYNVAWMSLLDGQADSVKIIKLFAPELQNNATSWVEFRPSASGRIKINGSINALRKTFNQLTTLQNIQIKADELDTNTKNFKQDSILVVNNSGDTIGKLMISCQKPITKHIIFVNVNTGTGFRTYNKQKIIDSLNLLSHNQIFKKWVLDTINTKGGLDTLEMTNDYNLNTANFHNSDYLFYRIERMYENHKGLNPRWDIVNDGNETVSTGDSAKKRHFVFMFNYSLPAGSDGWTTLGVSQGGGYLSLIWNNAHTEDISHELGHLLKLSHTFPDENNDGSIKERNYNIPKGVTRNYMDYSNPQDMFFYKQWKQSY